MHSAPIHGEARALLLVFGIALVLRVAFVLWAPAGLVSDADYYHGHALALMNGNGYTNADGSPAILWMPGWPAFLAGLYAIFGPAVRVAQFANALLGAGTAVIVCALGSRLFDRRTGWVAGILWAIWPGVLFYTAVLFSEVLFAALLGGAILLLVNAARAPERRVPWLGAAAVSLTLALWVRSEPLAFLPVFAWFLARSSGSWRRGALEAGAIAAVMLIGISPWTLRNAQAFGRFIPTSANGGSVFYEGNHAGAPGGNDLPAMLEFRARFAHLPLGEGDVARGAAGWREGLDFVRENPGEALIIAGRKLRVTYATDDRAPVLMRGFEGPHRILDSHYIPLRGYFPESTMLGLQQVANMFWYFVLALSAVGLWRVRQWRAETRVLVLGVMGTWIAIHAAMIGGARFHFPETLFLALLAAGGALALFDGARKNP